MRDYEPRQEKRSCHAAQRRAIVDVYAGQKPTNQSVQKPENEIEFEGSSCARSGGSIGARAFDKIEPNQRDRACRRIPSTSRAALAMISEKCFSIALPPRSAVCDDEEQEINLGTDFSVANTAKHSSFRVYNFAKASPTARDSSALCAESRLSRFQIMSQMRIQSSSSPPTTATDALCVDFNLKSLVWV